MIFIFEGQIEYSSECKMISDFFLCWCYMYSGEYDACDVTLSVYIHTG